MAVTGVLSLIPTRIVIVTGAAQGIGESIALKLADDGLDVAVVDLPGKSDKLNAVVNAIKDRGRRSLAILADMTVEADIVAMVDTTVQELGGLDVMIANAGVFGLKSVMEISVEEWDKMMAINTRGVFLCFKHAARQLVKQGRGGRLIAAASIAAKHGFRFASAYSASKFAVRGLVQSLALELKGHNIAVNAYAPGLVLTPMTTSSEDEKNGGPCSTIMKMAGLPVEQNLPKPSEIAELVSYMVKPEAHLLTGQCISVNGGVVVD